MDKNARIYVAGHTGLVGSGLVRELKRQGYSQILTATHDELDLRDWDATGMWMYENDPQYIFLAAATVGGIDANNSRPVDFLEDNLLIATNVIRAASKFQGNKLMFMGSSCIYPKHSPQPIKESYLLCGPLEPTNEWYAVAKIAGLKLCQAYRKQKGCNFISVMPTNLYGPGDRYHQGCHVIPALIRRFHEHKSDLQEVKVWGSGDVRREFLYVDDLARACLLLMDKYDGAEPVNIGYGSDITIKCLAGCVAKTVGLDPDRLYWDENALVGTPQKLLDSSVIHSFGWHPEVDLATGLSRAYADYCERYAPATVVNTGC